MNITLEPVMNGVVLTDQEGNKSAFVVEDSFTGNDDKLKVVELLYCVMEALGYQNNKYDEENVQIRVVHGRGYECKDKKCKICEENKP